MPQFISGQRGPEHTREVPWGSRCRLCRDKRTRRGLVSDVLRTPLAGWENRDTLPTFPAFPVDVEYFTSKRRVAGRVSVSRRGRTRESPANSRPLTSLQIWVQTDVLRANVAKNVMSWRCSWVSSLWGKGHGVLWSKTSYPVIQELAALPTLRSHSATESPERQPQENQLQRAWLGLKYCAALSVKYYY